MTELHDNRCWYVREPNNPHIARSSNVPPENIGNPTLLGLIATMIAALAFFLRHLITVTIPKIQESHIAMVERIVKDDREDRIEERRIFRDELNRDRDDRRMKFDALLREIRATNHNVMAIRDRGCANGPDAKNAEESSTD